MKAIEYRRLALFTYAAVVMRTPLTPGVPRDRPTRPNPSPYPWLHRVSQRDKRTFNAPGAVARAHMFGHGR
ncbi:hypothetical protein GCM10020254_78850 [Streptomyces goshikiensis]